MCAFINNFIPLILHSFLTPTPESMLSKVKERLKGLKYNIGFGGRGWGYTRKGKSMSTMEKEAILQKCLNTFIPHSVNAKLCYCRQVKPCMTMILAEITGINDIIMLLVVTTTQMLSPRPDRVSEMPMGVQG